MQRSLATRSLGLAAALSAALSAASCDPGTPEQSDGGPDPRSDARGALPDAPGADTGRLDASELRAIIERALPDAPAGIEGITLIVHDASDARVIEETIGDMAADRRLAIASASKLVTGLVLLRLVDSGAIAMSDTPRSVLGWAETSAADATLDHLGGFVSGMQPEALCLFDPAQTLQGCVATLDAVPTASAPGAHFEYGSTHQAVAAAMAEVATGESWATLFDRELRGPLALTDPGLRYYTLPKESLGDANPLVAGGMRATPNEYMEILSLLFHRGEHDGERLISETAIARMGSNGYPDATLDPGLARSNLRYSWSSWINCAGAASPCEVITSPGGLGFTPWVDRDHGYYAVLAMESTRLDGTPFSVGLMELLRPRIEALLGAR